MWSLALVSSEKFGELVVVLLLFKDKNKRKYIKAWRSTFMSNIFVPL